MLVHEGGYGVVRTDDGMFVFTRPDGERIPECGRPPQSVAAQTGGSFRGNFSERSGEVLDPFERTLQSYLRSRNPNLHIDARTGRGQWLGEQMDYSFAIEGLQCLDGRDSPTPRSPPPLQR